MIKAFAVTILAAFASAECYRPHDYPNEIGSGNQKISGGEHYVPQCAILRNKNCK